MRGLDARRALFIVLALSFIARLVLILSCGTYRHPTGWEYETIATNVLSGNGFVYTFLGTPYRSLTTPLYVALCVALYAITGHSYLAVLVVQSLISVALALVIFGIAREIFDEEIALVAAAVTAFHPGYVYYDVFNLIPLSIDALFIAGVTYLFLRGLRHLTVRRMVGIGALIGLGALSRGMIGSLLPFLALYLFVFCRDIGFRRKVGLVAVMTCAVFLVVAPWVIRNSLIHRQFVFIVTTTGENLWRGNNERATGASLTADRKSMLELWPEDFREKIYALDEIGQKRFFESEALAFIRQHPFRAARLYATKIFYFWWFSPQSGALYPGTYLVLYRYGYAAFLILSLVGFAALFRERDADRIRKALLIVCVVMGICLMQSIFYVEGRHRWLVEPLIGVFFAYGVMRLCRGFIRKAKA